jgi:Stage II sporulation protein E (SpoIIE)
MLPRRISVSAGLLWVALASATVQIAAQSVAAGSAPRHEGAPLRLDGGAVALGHPWQFHLGDDPAWASPNFDDSLWEQLSPSKTWGAQTHPNTEGFGWYRLHIAFARGAPGTIALLVPQVDDAYEVYWNGRLIGSHGKLPPQLNLWQNPRPGSFTLGAPESGVLAIRVWKDGFGSYDTGVQGGFETPPVLGSPQAVAAALGVWNYNWLLGQQLNFALNSLYALVALVCFIVWLRDRRQWLVLWMAGFAIAHATVPAFSEGILPLTDCMVVSVSTPSFCIGDLSLWFLLSWLLDVRSDARLMRVVRWAAIIEMVAGVLDAFTGFGFALPNPAPWQWVDALLTAPITIFEAIPFYIISVALSRRVRLDWTRWMVALVALLTQILFVCSYTLEQGSRFTHWTLGNRIASPLFTVFGSPVTADNISETLLLIVLAYAVYRYAAENTRHQLAMEQELESARAVQQVLIPAEIPAIPGFKIESIYKPAGEVGGDFFQILPLTAGGVLVIIGDVSGKGTPAAMTVALLVGTLRTLAHYTHSPGEILAAMNTRMLGRSQGGFTTCLALRADPDGTLTAANAGHLPPYLDGNELAIANGLPLGLDAHAAYPESTLRLAPNAQLTLLSDGVVEARNATGELFGFERAAAISSKSAERIAQAAQNHGQEDDITVLTLTRLCAGLEAATGSAFPALA